jgi:hypothetical protein
MVCEGRGVKWLMWWLRDENFTVANIPPPILFPGPGIRFALKRGI